MLEFTTRHADHVISIFERTFDYLFYPVILSGLLSGNKSAVRSVQKATDSYKFIRKY